MRSSIQQVTSKLLVLYDHIYAYHNNPRLQHFERAVISLVISLANHTIMSCNNLIWKIQTRVQAFQPFKIINSTCNWAVS